MCEHLRGKFFIRNAKVANKLATDLADWFGLDAGYIRVGDRVDIAIINPKGLADEIEAIQEAPMEDFGIEV